MATLTPFRYPGAKNKMLPILMEHIDKMMALQWNCFIDAFVGGGSVLLEVADKYPKINLFANDKDYNVYSFWSIVADTNTKKLDELLKLMEQPVTLKQFYKLRETPPNDDVEAAYHAIFFNRTTFSGIARSGPIGGKDQKSKYTVDCRWNFKKLKNKILKCNKLLAGRTVISNEDFSKYEKLIATNAPIYLDPPYYIQGPALYTESMTARDHAELATNLSTRDNWILSYDDCSEIRSLYDKNQIIDLAARYCINGKKTSWEKKNELIILP